MAAPLKAQIYVGDLPRTATKEFLHNFFEEAGVVKEVIFKNDKVSKSGHPIAYAFIEYESMESAKKAVEELNYTKLDGTAIRISLSDAETDRIRKKGLRDGTGNLFIKNLDKTIEVAQLHEAFANFGEIISCKIPLDDGKSRGYGYVQFRNAEDAADAMRDLKDASINGQAVIISQYERRVRKNPEEVYTNVYVKNLPTCINSQEKFKELFVEFGEFCNETQPYLLIGEDGQSKGFGFCSFKVHDDAVKAVEALNGKIVKDDDEKEFQLVANRAQTREERMKEIAKNTEKWRREQAEKYKGRNLYVRGFDENTTEEDLIKAFEEFGVIESVKVARKVGDDGKTENGESKKFGFVCFKTIEDAKKALSEAAFLEIAGASLYVANCVPAGQRVQNQAKVAQAPQNEFIGGMGTMMNMGGTMMNMTMTIPVSEKDQLRQDILERAYTENHMNALKGLSEDQAKALRADKEYFARWMVEKA